MTAMEAQHSLSSNIQVRRKLTPPVSSNLAGKSTINDVFMGKTHINGYFFVVVRGQKSLFIVLQYIIYIYIICSNTGMGQN